MSRRRDRWRGPSQTWPQGLIANACAAVFVGLAIAATPTAGSENRDHLYQARAIVTGQGEENRLGGYPGCFEDVLIKVSGDPRLIGDPRLETLKAQARTFVVSFDYHDRMAGLPTHDEQGTRDRPYDLIVHFDRDKVDAALRSLGLTPWTRRPRVAMLLGMKQAAASYVLTRDGDRTGPSDSLAAAADKRGVPIVIPTTSDLLTHGLTFEALTSNLAGLDRIAPDLGADVALVGQLIWSEQELGWAASWSLAASGVLHHWHIRGVSFDEAFRNAAGGAAQILSGHGDPK